MTATAGAKLTWRAGADKVAHAHAPRATRTLCGERIVPEQLAWPAQRKCRGCQALVEHDGLVL